ncbi:hypothetical protein GCM10020000_18560 [Streptomyces olivoverticillatus]
MEPALVTGVQKLKPCGTAVAGKVLPREKLELELVPRVVTARSAGCAGTCSGSAGAMETSSTQPRNFAGPRGES